MTEKKQIRIRIVQLLAIIAVLMSMFMTVEHYRTSPSQFCNPTAIFDCGKVNKSPYATLDGIFYLINHDLGWKIPTIPLHIPVALIGVFVFGGITFFAANQKQRRNLKILTGISLLFAGYLFLIEVFMLKVFCPFCLMLDILLIVIVFLIYTPKAI